jgi:thiamine pyrophosphate-dependent acetolactate synthase large subunit-like protein
MARYGSDLIVEGLEDLGIEYVALNPGASFRGLHDSLVERGRPEVVLALHEGACVAIAHGYAKSAGRPMAALVHNLVGLQHASMAIFNAWADDAQVLVLGGAGPLDTSRRRPWIDSVHTPSTQNTAIRDVVKWDATPASLAAVPDALLRAHDIATTLPYGPTYVALDVEIQEQQLPDATAPFGLVPLTTSSFAVPTPDLERFADLLADAHRPLIIADGSGRSRAGYEGLIRLAERLMAPVVDLGARHSFPNRHVCDRTEDRERLIAESDVILVLDPRDLAFAIGRTDHVARGWTNLVPDDTSLLVIGLNPLLHRGFLDREPVVATAQVGIGDTAIALPTLVEMLDIRTIRDRESRAVRLAEEAAERDVRRANIPAAPDGRIHPAQLAVAVWDAVRGGPVELAFPAFRGWARRSWDLAGFNAVLGGSGGAGLGYGPGAAIGAALAHRGDDTLVASLQPDGDLLYSATALWTAAHHRLPMLMVVENNRSYGADRLHQARVARVRGRSEDHASIGIDLDDPSVDIAGLARAQGVEAFGAIEDIDELPAALARATAVVRDEGRPVLVEVVVERPE